MHVISISTNLQRRDPVVQTEPFHTEGKDMKSTHEMAPTSQHQIFSHNSRKRKKWMDAYRSAPRAGAGHRSTRGQGRGGRGCGPWCHHSSSSRTPCERPDRQRTKSEAAGLESRIGRGSPLRSETGSPAMPSPPPARVLLDSPRRRRLPLGCVRGNGGRAVERAGMGLCNRVSLGHWIGIGSTPSDHRSVVTEGECIMCSPCSQSHLKKAKFQQKYEW